MLSAYNAYECINRETVTSLRKKNDDMIVQTTLRFCRKDSTLTSKIGILPLYADRNVTIQLADYDSYKMLQQFRCKLKMLNTRMFPKVYSQFQLQFEYNIMLK